MSKTLYSAIVFMADNTPVRKYRNISNINNFINFARSIGADYFNLYEKVSKRFQERIYIKKGDIDISPTFTMQNKPKLG